MELIVVIARTMYLASHLIALCADVHIPRIAYTSNASSPDVSRGSALILVDISRYELGEQGPKFSGL